MTDPAELMTDPFDVAGRNLIVTGAARGIGHAIAAQFLQAGANVVLSDVDADGLKAAVDRLEHHPGRSVPFPSDISDLDDINALVGAALAEFGSVDVLVNNAGVYTPTPLHALDPDAIDRLFAVNVKGLLFLSAACAAVMAPGSAIVNISSLGARRPPFPGMSAYHATKGAVDVLTLDLALELGPKGIRVNSAAPGGVTTAGTPVITDSHVLTDDEFRRVTERAHNRPLGRMAEPADLAPVVLFLASSAARFVTGQCLLVDGGYYLS